MKIVYLLLGQLLQPVKATSKLWLRAPVLLGQYPVGGRARVPSFTTTICDWSCLLLLSNMKTFPQHFVNTLLSLY